MSDTYKTLSKQSEGIYKDKGSKFIAIAQPVFDIDEIKQCLENIRKQYYDARHHCYAYRIGVHNEEYRINDDGEPSGTAGKPIYGQILSHELTNVLIVVVRYFGGVKLGVRGLIDAYKGAASEAIINNHIIEQYVYVYYEITFDYALMNDVMKILKDDRIEQLKTSYENYALIQFRIRESIAMETILPLQKLNIQVNRTKTI